MEYKYTIVKLPEDGTTPTDALNDPLHENYDTREEAEEVFSKLTEKEKETHTIVEMGYQKPKGGE